MRRFIFTGAPGSGKTSILRELEVEGFGVVEEAATDVVAAGLARGTEVWREASFIDTIARLQRDRQILASERADLVQFHDRCVVCTAALAVYLGYPFSPFLRGELERVKRDAIYERRVFFVRHLGFIERTEARRISLEDAVRFEGIHLETYRGLGYEPVLVEAGSLGERVGFVKAAL